MIRSLEKSSDLIGNRILDLTPCSVVSESTTQRRVPSWVVLTYRRNTSMSINYSASPRLYSQTFVSPLRGDLQT
jgi:hypothetical protein